jgi:hypothetical protein
MFITINIMFANIGRLSSHYKICKATSTISATENK